MTINECNRVTRNVPEGNLDGKVLTISYKAPTKVRAWGRWEWVVYRYCAGCGREIKLRAGDTRRRPNLGPGAILCDCGGLVRI